MDCLHGSCFGGQSQCSTGCVCYNPATGTASCSTCCIARTPNANFAFPQMQGYQSMAMPPQQMYGMPSPFMMPQAMPNMMPQMAPNMMPQAMPNMMPSLWPCPPGSHCGWPQCGNGGLTCYNQWGNAVGCGSC